MDRRLSGMGSAARMGLRRARRFAAAWMLCVALTPPVPAQAFERDDDSFTISVRPVDIWPPAPVTDLVGTAGAEGQAFLQWTAPQESTGTHPTAVAAASYQLRVATFSVQDLGGDTTAWFSLAAPVPAPLPMAPGSQQSVLTALEGGTTYYFALKTVDVVGNVSIIDVNARGGAAQQARVPVVGVAGVTDLSAVPGTANGSIDLVWSAPGRVGTLEPSRYELRVSTSAQIPDDAAFQTARPLTAFSSSTPPVPGVPGARPVFTVSGLTPSATYYFAVRLVDSGAPAYKGAWRRAGPFGLNLSNSAVARYVGVAPSAVTDLSAAPDLAQLRAIRLNWTSPAVPGGTPVDHYIVKVNTLSLASYGGSADAWFDLADATTVVTASALPAGATETLSVGGLSQFFDYYVAVKSVDLIGLTSLIDAKTAGVSTQPFARPRQIAAISNLTALPGAASGSVSLTWTEPDSAELIAPLAYDLRVSTVANMDDDASFDAAQPLSAFSGTPLSVPTGSVGPAALVVTGLTPFTTYYFALRMQDSQPVVSQWSRLPLLAINANNYSLPNRIPGPPDAVTDLTALTGADDGEIALAWTAPRNPNFTTVTSYELRYATFSRAGVVSDAAWLSRAETRTLAPAKAPGALEGLTLTGLTPTLYFFAVRSIDRGGDVSPLDLAAATPAQAQARSRGISPVTDLHAGAGASAGELQLSWSEPGRSGTQAPERYELRASSASNIGDDAAFAAAQPLSVFTGTPLPAPTTAYGETRTLVLTGLNPLTTYYFALRVEDSSGTARLGRWLRDPALGLNASNFGLPRFVLTAPDAVTDLTALATASEGELALAWTAPRNANFVPIARYELRFATFSIAQTGGDSAAWYALSAASAAAVSPAHDPGSVETFLLQGLNASSTFYFAVRSYDAISEVSALDARATGGLQVFAKPFNLPPATPSGLSAGNGLNKAFVRWDALSPAQAGVDFKEYALYRSSQSGGPYDLRIATTAAALTDWPLTAFTTYYYRISGRDQEGLESTLSPVVAALPYTLPPMEPLGLTQSISSNTFNLNWSTTTRFADGTLFESTGTPLADELIGYQVSRSTDPCDHFSLSAVNGVSQTSFTDVTNGDLFYYRLRSYNTLGVSTDSLAISSLGDRSYFIDDCASRVVLPNSSADLLLNGARNGLGDDIQIARRRLPQEVGDKIFQSVEFVPMLGGVSEVKNLVLAPPVPVVLHFVTQGGKPVPHTSGVSLQDVRAQKGTVLAAAEDDVQNLGIFWNNGVEFKKLYGKVDAAEQTVTVVTPNLGRFQVRGIFREQGVTFDLSNITSRIFTPNGDGKNDVVIFSFDNPKNASVEGKIYDLRGAFVAMMAPGPLENSLMWDGKMDGRTVTGGVYIYQVKGDGKTFNGTLVVAR
ncbi:MAG: hypothetical protein WC969_02585 [Elusimicrobiota bacterium]|jgi:gliding motility-associated-like protein